MPAWMDVQSASWTPLCSKGTLEPLEAERPGIGHAWLVLELKA